MADGFRPSDEQRRAIGFDGRACIVSAAAGSGKTSVLVERVRRRLLGIGEDEDGNTVRTEPVPADRMVITTFTNAAAAEIRARIEDALSDEAASPDLSDEGRELIDTQLLRLRDAYICTTHSLCADLLRRYSSAAGLRPDFKVLDTSQTDLLKARSMKTVMENFCAAPGDAASRELLYGWFARENDSAIEELVGYLYEFSRKITRPDEFFAEWLGYYKDPSTYDGIIRKNYNERVQSELVDVLADIRANIKALVPLTKQAPAAPAKGKALTSNPMEPVGEVWEGLLVSYDAAVWGQPDFREKLKAANAAYAAAAKTPDASGKKKIIDLNTTSKQVPSEEMKALISQLKADCKALAKSTPELRPFDDDMRTCAPVLEALLELVRRYDEDYSARKAELGGLDFDDLERRMLDILRDGAQPACSVSQPGETAREIAGSIDFIIVDEFQDSNEVQYEIYRLISRDKKNLFLVGDIKQSIYRFRGSDPLVFRRLSEEDPDFEVIPLNKNFRSRETVINTVNQIFEGTMTKELGDVDYNDDCKLVFGADYPDDTDENRVEFAEISASDDLTARQAEAVWIANRIKKMVADGFEVNDRKTGMRPCRYSDFGIIMRSYAGYAKIYTGALDEAGIPYEAKADEEYTDLEEVKYLLSLLRVIDDPYRDGDLAAVLMREPYRLSADELAEIKLTEGFSLLRGLRVKAKLDKNAADALERLNGGYQDGGLPDGDGLADILSKPPYSFGAEEIKELELYGRYKHLHLWTGLREYAARNERAAAVLAEIEEYRAFAAENSPARLIRKICDESMIVSSFEAEKGGLKKCLNLRLMPHYAEVFPGSESAGLYDFLRYLETLRRRRIKLARAEGDSRGTNAVRIMTIHGSKGLEFPICFMANVPTAASIKRDCPNIICDPRYGIGMTVMDGRHLLKIDNFLNRYIVGEYRRLELSESMRLLYVAVTRAREKLIITAPRPPQNANESHWGWIKNSAAAREDGLIGSPRLLAAEDIGPDLYIPDDSKNTAEDLSAAEGNDIDTEPGYGYWDSARLPAKFTATQIGVKNVTESDRPDDKAFRVLRVPSFLGEGEVSKLRGKKLGDAYHKAMELIDFTTPPDKAGEVLDGLCACGALTRIERESIADEDIAYFLESDICKRAAACGANNIYKEHPLFYEPDADELREICAGYGIGEWNDSEKPFIQGITDLFFVEGDGIVLVDYKTNTRTTPEKLTDEYSGQLAIYAHALTESMGMPVKEKLLYSFTLEAEGRRNGETGRGTIVIL
ncbi:MAG: UvrD-helicase domain-containing protein [Ruminiclostridium sp.]|nr:UvrD-helicase domain-containing protein [Ruminiclostridium sp.]